MNSRLTFTKLVRTALVQAAVGFPIAVQQAPLISILLPAHVLGFLPPLMVRPIGARGVLVVQPIWLKQVATAVQ
jgi:hypothetical protein